MENEALIREPLVNLCITTFNRLDYTKRCISSILETTRDDETPFMITVIDNGSTDNTQDYLKELRGEGKIDTLILLKENIGIAKAQNIGWKLFEDTPYTGKIDNDIVFNKKGWLDAIINTFVYTDKIGALGYQCADDGANYPIVEENGIKYKSKQGNLGGACCFIPKKIIDIIGFFNENLGLYGEEDCLIGEKVMIAGYRNAYMLDNKTITHLPDPPCEYRTFKDKEREANLKGDFWQMMREYRNGTRPLKFDTNILNEVEFEVI